MAASAHITATFGDKKPLEVLENLIRQREKAMRFETTENAVKATAITILTSIRARTKVVNPDKASGFGVAVMPAPGVVAGFKGSKGRRVVRAIGGHEMEASKIVNLAGQYQRGESVLCFVVIFKSPKMAEFFKGGYERVYVIARSAADVRTWAKTKLKKYIERYKGMAKWTLGQAQSQIARANVGKISDVAEKTALKNLLVQVAGSGYSSGSFSILVEDKLQYAIVALRGGESDLDLALKKAANSTAAKIRNAYTLGFDENVPTPFPEVVGVK